MTKLDKDFINELMEMLPDRERIGLELKQMRLDAQMTSEEVADEIGTAVGTIYNYENGSTKVPLETAAALLRIYRDKTGEHYSLDNLVQL